MYEVELTPQASDDLGRLDRAVGQRVLNRIRWLAENFEALIPEPLSGPWRGVYKLRVGDYRVLYTFGKGRIVVRAVGHRSEVYNLL
jgi:mRNA interferase RelE/StbE